ncbi:uncharacterized protein LOC130685286 [Daphnia carinata]|uniref:uncharacterized protein LOC130685286 n=1 Tax=Daphnia carinata TaxID=120202 RepID=UPI00257DA723|nr:uncharacterized protein LOC130685286 [Daphnia carinata]
MKASQLIVIVLMSLLAFGAFTDGRPTDDETNTDSINQEVSPYSSDTDLSDSYYTSARLRRSDGRHHHHGFIAGAATGAVVANHHQPNYYAPTYYYPPTYYAPPNYYDNYYY